MLPDFSVDDITPVVTDWLVAHGIPIVFIIVGAYVVQRFSRIFIERGIRRLVRPDHTGSHAAEKQREDTLIEVCNGAFRILVWLMAGMMVLSEVGVNIGPILVAAGVAGLALGFGGQYLIRDLISGLFIILENQYRVGDVVCFGTTCGVVEDISLRMTIMRDLDGTVHHIPHGEIQQTANLSKDFARINLDIGVAYDSDLEKVIKVVNKVGAELAADPEWKEHIIKAPEFLRVNEFADSSIVVKITGETQTMQQWATTGELRKRLKVAFDKAKIEIPFPQRDVHMRK